VNGRPPTDTPLRWFEHCQFNASVTFVGASLVGNASFEGSTFKAEASFNGMKVSGYDRTAQNVCRLPQMRFKLT
jgi:hypothetical protein